MAPQPTQLRILAFVEEAGDRQLLDEAEPTRPRKRSDCIDGPRPCPWARCKYSLLVHVTGTRVEEVWPDRDLMAQGLEFPPETCALDVADREGLTLEEVGAFLNLTRERIRQIEIDVFERSPEIAALAADYPEAKHNGRRRDTQAEDDDEPEPEEDELTLFRRVGG